jgi:RsiW-degrading membrane proteinase PrsW (M82 family)
MFCGNCGNTIPDGAQVCTRCGAGVARPAAYMTPQPAPQAAAPNLAPCPRCRTQIPLSSYTCPACALPLAQQPPRPNTVPCPRCRAQVLVGSYSCQACGFIPGLPPLPAKGAKSGGIVSNFWSQVDNYASLDKLEGFSLKEMFSEVFRKREQEQIDDYFLVGSKYTTPEIMEVPTGWPKPWFFGRVLLFVSILYFAQYIAFNAFRNTLMLPGMMMTGALAMPFATAILFFELNAPRNVSFYRVLTLVCMGGVVSIFVSLIGFQVSQLHSIFGAPAAGIVEEIGKLLTVILMVRKVDKPYILNGCLFGAAVGAGFAAFESAGYAFNTFLGMLPDK